MWCGVTLALPPGRLARFMPAFAKVSPSLRDAARDPGAEGGEEKKFERTLGHDWHAFILIL